MDSATLALNRLEGILRSGEELSSLLASVEEQARAAGARAGLAAEDALGGHQAATRRFLFVCAVRLAEIASAAARGSQALAAVDGVPGEREAWPQWVRSVEREAMRMAAAGRELQQLAAQASLLALEAKLTAWEPAGDVTRVAELLRQASRSLPAWAAETMWAAEDAGRHLGRRPNEVSAE
jgi:hypothetical protein